MRAPTLAVPQIPQDATGEVIEQDFDPGAFAEQYVRENATAEVGANDLTNTFQNFLNIIGVRG